MTMIKILEAPTQNERHKFVSFPNLNGSHQFNLDNYDIRIYYHKLFDNRTSKDKLYIDKYNSLDELEEDVYGNITHIDGGEWTTKSFKEVYNSLDKEKFLIKINQAIKKYGNMITLSKSTSTLTSAPDSRPSTEAHSNVQPRNST